MGLVNARSEYSYINNPGSIRVEIGGRKNTIQDALATFLNHFGIDNEYYDAKQQKNKERNELGVDSAPRGYSESGSLAYPIIAGIQHDILDIGWDGVKGIYYGITEGDVKFEIGGAAVRGWRIFNPE